KAMLERQDSLWPDRPLQVGEEFEAGLAGLRKAFSMDPAGEASARGKVLEVRDVEGRQQAKVNLNARLKTKVEGIVDMAIELQGEGWFDVKTSRMIEGQMQGPLKISGQHAQQMQEGAPPMQLMFNGDGQFSYSEK